jgi:hypothetical protein
MGDSRGRATLSGSGMVSKPVEDHRAKLACRNLDNAAPDLSAQRQINSDALIYD